MHLNLYRKAALIQEPSIPFSDRGRVYLGIKTLGFSTWAARTLRMCLLLPIRSRMAEPPCASCDFYIASSSVYPLQIDFASWEESAFSHGKDRRFQKD